MDRTTYGLDIAKNVMQLHWVEAETGEIGRKKLARAKLAAYFAPLKPVRIVMEACGSAHHWARVLGALGHEVQLLPAVQVRPFVRSNKDDAADARAIGVAAQQSDIRRVPQKSVQQQAVLALHRTRSHWVSVRTATVNSLRGLLYEFGVVLRGGRQAGLKALAEQRASIDEQLPATMRSLVDAQLQTLAQIGQRIDQLEREIAALQKQLKGARALEHAKDKPKWLEQLLARRPMNVAVVALANKMARTAWAIVAHGRTYQRDWKSTRPGSGGAAQAAAA
jgi:transposase